MIDGALRPGSLLIFAPTALREFYVANLDDMGLWLSGYYDGKSDSLQLDTERMKARRKIEANCSKTANQPVMKVFKGKKVEEERLPS